MLAHIPTRNVDLQAKLFRGFADSSRLAILSLLQSGPSSVTEIVSTTGLSQSNVSNHLACLRDCGLVHARQQGRYVYYQLSDPRVARLLHLAGELLIQVATGVDECVNYREPSPTQPTQRKAAAHDPHADD